MTLAPGLPLRLRPKATAVAKPGQRTTFASANTVVRLVKVRRDIDAARSVVPFSGLLAAPDTLDVGFSVPPRGRPRGPMEAEQSSISRSSRERCEVVTLAGELDMVGAPTVSDTLDALSDSARPVVVDL